LGELDSRISFVSSLVDCVVSALDITEVLLRIGHDGIYGLCDGDIRPVNDV